MNHLRLIYSAAMEKWLVVLPFLLSMAFLLGCGAAAEESSAMDFASAMPQSAPAAPAAMEVPVEVEVIREVAVEKSVPASVAKESAETSVILGNEFLPSFDEVQASVASQNRIIVRTVGMGLVVENVAGSVDRVAAVAQELGGWTVSSDRSAIHQGNVSVRVPAQQLDEAIRRIRSMAIRVDWESSGSQDVTDEYVDSNSRLRSLRATEEALLNLLDKADEVEDALEVQRELTGLQAEIESLEGRIKFLEQTAAFSLINVTLTLAPKTMSVDAGADQTFSAGQPARFRATFTPPEGIDTFSFIWDFGDGAKVEGTGSAPTTQPGQRVTATVTHFFEDDRDSPYIVQLEITGTGSAGLVEGTDTLIATVTRIPTIEVFAGEHRVVEEGDEVEYSGSFTRPEGLWDIQYRWDFNDGSPTITGIPEEGATRATDIHIFENYRPQPYQVTLTVTAQSEAGEVKGSGSFEVFVSESQGLLIGNWDLLESAKSAIRMLSGVALAVVNIIIWIAVFSPVWLGIGVVIFLASRFNRYRQARWPGISLIRGSRPSPADLAPESPGASPGEQPPSGEESQQGGRAPQ